MTTVTNLWLTRHIDRAIEVFNALDEGYPAECRYATLDGEEVVVLGLLGPARDRKQGATSVFEPAFILVNPALEFKLENVRVFSTECDSKDFPEGNDADKADDDTV